MFSNDLCNYQASKSQNSITYLVMLRFKERCSVDIQEIQGNDSEFVNKVSGGRLGHPPSELGTIFHTICLHFSKLARKNAAINYV